MSAMPRSSALLYALALLFGSLWLVKTVEAGTVFSWWIGVTAGVFGLGILEYERQTRLAAEGRGP